MSYWEQLERPAPDAVMVDGVELRRRSRVRLRPQGRADVFDVALDGRTAVVEELVESVEGVVQLAVTVEDDPGRDLGAERQIGHRFFFSTAEVEPLEPQAPPAVPAQRVLVAGIGNVFFGDDGFGVAVAGRLAAASLPPGVDVVDFGIRGMDLAYALRDYDVAILVDAVPRGGAPGTLYVIEPDLEHADVGPDAHAMDPVKVLALARGLGDPLPRVLVVGCEPATVPGEDEDLSAELSEAVRAALDGAVRTVESLLDELTSDAVSDRKEGLR
jgi:hydrogenase maturation protease